MAERVTRGYGLLEGFLARRRAAVARKVLADVPRSGRVLDVGCGGQPVFLATCGFAERHGVDQIFSEEHVRGGIHFAPYDAVRDGNLPFPDDHFDAVTMLAVFEHVDPAFLTPLLREVRRVLRPGGRVVLTTPASWTEPVLRILSRLRLVSAEEIEEHKDAYDHAGIARYLEQAGFDPGRLELGTFELRMNLWASAVA